MLPAELPIQKQLSNLLVGIHYLTTRYIEGGARNLGVPIREVLLYNAGWYKILYQWDSHLSTVKINEVFAFYYIKEEDYDLFMYLSFYFIYYYYSYCNYNNYIILTSDVLEHKWRASLKTILFLYK